MRYDNDTQGFDNESNKLYKGIYRNLVTALLEYLDTSLANFVYTYLLV